jgi:hypothetical protein
MQSLSLREEARQLVDRLSDNATWEDLMYQIYVHQAIERGLQDSDAQRTMTVDEVKRRLNMRYED